MGYPIEVDEKVIIQLWHKYLTFFNKNPSGEALTIVKNLASSIYVITAPKYGLFNAD